ncbi:MAG: hypothetical protein JST59_29195 [Actinobacteria bacterium]|nr:hypothetical protein [Actinomycetota bacterium]
MTEGNGQRGPRAKDRQGGQAEVARRDSPLVGVGRAAVDAYLVVAIVHREGMGRARSR